MSSQLENLERHVGIAIHRKVIHKGNMLSFEGGLAEQIYCSNRYLFTFKS